jgi:hypothetical protein
MALTPLGREMLHRMLLSPGRVVIVNRSTPEVDLRIAAAVIVRHDGVRSTRQMIVELDLQADESEWLDPLTPVIEPPVMLEVLLRLSLNGRVVETYVSATPTASPPARGWEAGVHPVNNALDPTDTAIPELPEFAAYLIPFE